MKTQLANVTKTGIPVAGFAVAGALAVLFFFNPAEHGFFPPCLFHKITGLNCPGCGATRALHELLHGHVVAAFHDNALLVLALPVLAGLAVRRWCGEKSPLNIPAKWLWVFLGVMVVFTVWRNLPAGAWLSP
jgi:hypothetical protein